MSRRAPGPSGPLVAAAVGVAAALAALAIGLAVADPVKRPPPGRPMAEAAPRD